MHGGALRQREIHPSHNGPDLSSMRTDTLGRDDLMKEINQPFLTVLQMMVSSSFRKFLAWLVGGCVFAPPLRIHSWRVK